MLLQTKAIVIGLMLNADGTANRFAPKTLAEINKLVLQGVVCKASGEAIGGFESAQIIVKGGVVYFRDPGTNQLFSVPPELIVVITPTKAKVPTRMQARMK